MRKIMHILSKTFIRYTGLDLLKLANPLALQLACEHWSVPGSGQQYAASCIVDLKSAPSTSQNHRLFVTDK